MKEPWFVQPKIGDPDDAERADQSVTVKEYVTLAEAYSEFIQKLFPCRLPSVLITFQRHRGVYGYFAAGRMRSRDGAHRVSEIALNPDGFVGRTDKQILSTLAHEGVHAFQEEWGNPGRRGYHNKEFGRLMLAIGLVPSATGKPGGKMTGEQMSHYFVDDGPFSRECDAFLKNHRLMWESAIEPDGEADDGADGNVDGTEGNRSKRKKRQTRVKYSCPCRLCGGLNVWAKPNTLIDCHYCSQELRELVLLVDETDRARAKATPAQIPTPLPRKRVLLAPPSASEAETIQVDASTGEAA